jgi:hypothetical protein
MRRSHPARALLAAAALASVLGTSACGRDALAPVEPGISVLFIGNAYTAWYDLPGVVEALLDSVGPRPNHVDREIMAGLGLEDHWFLGVGQEWINKGGWDYVLMQQGPSVSGGRASLVDYTKRFAEVIRNVGAEPGLWEVWPVPDSANSFDAISASYQAAADSAGGFMIPAADTWQEAWKLDPSLPFYESDHVTPTPLGIWALGVTIAAYLDHKDPAAFPDGASTTRGIVITVDQRSGTLVKSAAARVLGLR